MYVTGADEGTNAGGFVVTVVVVHACIQACIGAYRHACMIHACQVHKLTVCIVVGAITFVFFHVVLVVAFVVEDVCVGMY